MSEKFQHSIELIGGYTSVDAKTKEETLHTTVTFGRRITVKDMIDLDNDPQGANPTQYQDLVRRKMITAFGTMKMPVPLNVLLSLDSIDREDIASAAEKYLADGRGERKAEYLPDFKVQIPFGFDIDGTEYDIVQFGNRITGNDEVQADVFGQGVARRCYLMGRQISRLMTSDGAASIEGPIDLEHFKTLDAGNVNLLWVGAEMFRQSFRLNRRELSEERNGEDGVAVGENNRMDGNGDSESAK